MSENYNVCGVLVMASPELGPVVETSLSKIEGVEVHANENGKLVVTVEGPNAKDSDSLNRPARSTSCNNRSSICMIRSSRSRSNNQNPAV